MAKNRVVLILEQDGASWKMQHRIADDDARKLPPNAGPGDVNTIAGWFAEGWRIVSGSGYPQKPAVNVQDAVIARPGNDRLVLTLEHD